MIPDVSAVAGRRQSTSSFSSQHAPMTEARSSASALEEIEVAADTPGKRRDPGHLQAGDEMLGANRSRASPSPERANEVPPVRYSGRIDRDPFELRDAGDALLDMDRSIVVDRDERH